MLLVQEERWQEVLRLQKRASALAGRRVTRHEAVCISEQGIHTATSDC